MNVKVIRNVAKCDAHVKYLMKFVHKLNDLDQYLWGSSRLDNEFFNKAEQQQKI